MKTFLSTVTVGLLLACGCSSDPASPAASGGPAAMVTAKLTEPTVVEASCGQCKFDLEGKAGCDLAVRFDGKAYFVDGFKMEQFGHTHGADGMCEVVRKAKVTGQVVNNRFAASTFELLPMEH